MEKHGRVESTLPANQQIGTTKIPNSRGSTLRNPGTAGMQTRNSATFTGEGIRRTLVACECQLHAPRRQTSAPAAITATTELQSRNQKTLTITSINFTDNFTKLFFTTLTLYYVKPAKYLTVTKILVLKSTYYQFTALHYVVFLLRRDALYYKTIVKFKFWVRRHVYRVKTLYALGVEG